MPTTASSPRGPHPCFPGLCRLLSTSLARSLAVPRHPSGLLPASSCFIRSAAPTCGPRLLLRRPACAAAVGRPRVFPRAGSVVLSPSLPSAHSPQREPAVKKLTGPVCTCLSLSPVQVLKPTAGMDSVPTQAHSFLCLHITHTASEAALQVASSRKPFPDPQSLSGLASVLSLPWRHLRLEQGTLLGLGPLPPCTGLCKDVRLSLVLPQPCRHCPSRVDKRP